MSQRQVNSELVHGCYQDAIDLIRRSLQRIDLETGGPLTRTAKGSAVFKLPEFWYQQAQHMTQVPANLSAMEEVAGDLHECSYHKDPFVRL